MVTRPHHSRTANPVVATFPNKHRGRQWLICPPPQKSPRLPRLPITQSIHCGAQQPQIPQVIPHVANMPPPRAPNPPTITDALGGGWVGGEEFRKTLYVAVWNVKLIFKLHWYLRNLSPRRKRRQGSLESSTGYEEFTDPPSPFFNQARYQSTNIKVFYNLVIYIFCTNVCIHTPCDAEDGGAYEALILTFAYKAQTITQVQNMRKI